MKFVAETAKILRKNSRLQQFVFLADRSIELLQGNLELKKYILLQITIGYDKLYIDDKLKTSHKSRSKTEEIL